MQNSFSLRPVLLLPLLAAAVTLALDPAKLAAQAGARERTMFVSATGADGTPLQTLTPADVTVTEDGVRREVLRVSRAVEPIDIALLVDNSAASGDLLVPLREGLKRFIAVMSEPGGTPYQIAIIGLGARPTILVDYTSDAKRLTDAASRLFPETMSGMTLLDALVEVSQGLERRETPRAVIVPVLTDGQEFTNRYYRDVLSSLVKAGAGVHEVTIGTFPISNEDAVRNRAFVLDEAPRLTGGQRIDLLASSAVTSALERLANELRVQYKVVYSRPESLIPPEKTEVSAGRAGITVRGTPARGQKTGA
jgi:hypothetical protein